MMFSIFTPTNNTKYLKELHDSIINQSFKDWEWVIVLNGGVVKPSYIKDSRIKVSEFTQPVVGVGQLKKYACSMCVGSYLIEVDHDDMLRDDALSIINDTAIKESPDFMYSNFLEFKGSESNVYGDQFGWVNYETQFHGKPFTAMRAFAIDPSSLSSIHHAPNHVRVWRRKFYKSINGHNGSLVVCDDYDLLIRTYLAGGKMTHIDHCLYYYRLRGDEGNTYLKYNDQIQLDQRQLSRDNKEAIVSEWCKRNALKKIDLGGAHNSPDGYVSVDLQDADINTDLSKGLPFDDNSIGCIRAFDFLEHIPHCNNSSCTHDAGQCAVGMMKEIYRVLVPNGVLISATPSTDGRGAFQDQTHVSFWNPNSFWYFTNANQSKYYRNNNCKFIANDIDQSYPTAFHEQHNILYVYATLIAVKGDRVAGLNEN
jgi:glycosyltransferase involved in cell wall biosynthesis